MEDTETFSELVGCKILEIYSDGKHFLVFQVLNKDKKIQMLFYQTYKNSNGQAFLSSMVGVKKLINSIEKIQHNGYLEDNAVNKITKFDWGFIKSQEGEDNKIIQYMKFTLHTNNGFMDIVIKNEYKDRFKTVGSINLLNMEDFLKVAQNNCLRQITEDFDY